MSHFLWNYFHFSTVLFLLKVGVKQEEKKPELKEIKLNGNDVYTCKYLQAKYYETPNVYTGVRTLMYIQRLTWDSIREPIDSQLSYFLFKLPIVRNLRMSDS